jgi:hypothetical protein
MNYLKRYFPFLLGVVFSAPVCADVMYQCVDDSGHKTFSNIKAAAKGSKCTAMDLGPAVTVPASKSSAAKAPTPSSFPKVDDDSQKARDTDRRRILEGELSAEKSNLEQARKDLAEQEGKVLPEERMAGGGISGGKVQERVQPYKDKVALHERNIEAIQKELSKLR